MTAIVPTTRAPLVVARNQDEATAASATMVEWFTQKVGTLNVEIRELDETITAAVAAGMNGAALRRTRARLAHKQTFFRKALALVERGYVLVPSTWHTDVVAVRTNRPARGRSESSYSFRDADSNLPDTRPRALPVGEGKYVGPKQLVRQWTVDRDGKTHYVTLAISHGAIDFPVDFAKPEIADALATALNDRIFDEIGVARDRVDPLLIGTIRAPGVSGWEMSFFIAWSFDLKRFAR